MQKIKYPVGSILSRNDENDYYLIDVSKNEMVAYVLCKQAKFVNNYTQNLLDEFGYTLVSSPRWVPKIGDEIYFEHSGEIAKGIYDENEFYLFLLRDNRIKKTREECKKKIDEINSREI